jgi:hypothetical protein
MLTQVRNMRQDPGDLFPGEHCYLWLLFHSLIIDQARSTVDLIAMSFSPVEICPQLVLSPVKEFHDCISSWTKIGMEIHWPGCAPEDIPDPYRQRLPDDAAVVFTHADLNPRNIMVTQLSPHCVTALIDWAESGWYPAYWEFFKTTFTANTKSEWATEYIPRFLEEPSDDCLDGVARYPHRYGY